MPVVRSTQASVTLSEGQFQAAVDIVQGKSVRTTTVTFEETSLEGVIAIRTPKGSSLITQGGEVQKLGHGA